MGRREGTDRVTIQELSHGAYQLGIQPLSRNSRGSLEVFNPADYNRSSSQNVGSANFSMPSSQKSVGGANLTKQCIRKGVEHELLELSGRESRSIQLGISGTPSRVKTIQQTEIKSLQVGQTSVPTISRNDIAPTMSRKDTPGSCPATKVQFLSANRDGQGRTLLNELDGKQSVHLDFERHSSEAMAERVAGWGLVLKTEAGSGRVEGVRTRTSDEEREFLRSSEERRSVTSVTSGTSLRTSEESDLGSDISRASRLPHVSRDVLDALETFQQTFVITDGTKPDFPIMYASAGFFKMTGYTSAEAIGQNCRFLQGKGTDPEEVRRMWETLKAGNGYCGRILNYKKDGSPFWNLLTISPIKDDDGSALKYIGMQVEVTKYTEGFKENALRPNGLSKSLIKYDARQKDRAYLQVTELVEAMKNPRATLQSINQQVPFNISGGVIKPILPPTSHQDMENGVSEDQHASGAAKFDHFQLSDEPETDSQREGTTKLSCLLGLLSFLRLRRKGRRSRQELAEFIEPEILMTKDEDMTENLNDLGVERLKEIRRGVDLATTLERIEKSFVITDPRLQDNPIIFASDNFLELTEYTREEVLGLNCRFLQGPETDPETVKEIREAIRDEREITVQLLNYTKPGTQFWNLFHLQPLRDQKGELQYFAGIQLNGTKYVNPISKRLPEKHARAGVKIIRETAININEAVRDLPDANLKFEELWKVYYNSAFPRPHKKRNESWKLIWRIRENGEKIQLKHFRPLKQLGFGDIGSVHLVELRGTDRVFAMKAIEKSAMVKRNKVHRACVEREILGMMDHPFLPTLYASFETRTHVCLVTDFCPAGELLLLLKRQPKKVFCEDAARFYAAEVIVALEYLHCQGVIYRDLKPENVLLQEDGHVMLSDFDLSFLRPSNPLLIVPPRAKGKHKQHKVVQHPVFVAEPVATCNSFVGTEEYMAPEVISGAGHNSSIDWWAVGILLYEMLYGHTPFRGKTRKMTFANILHKNVTFPRRIPTSLVARQLINELLQRDPECRLGSQGGVNEIKKHPFFFGMNWTLIRCMRPPLRDTPISILGDELDRDAADLEWDAFEASSPIEFF